MKDWQKTALALSASVLAGTALAAIVNDSIRQKQVEVAIPMCHPLIFNQHTMDADYRIREIATSDDAKVVMSGGGYEVTILDRDALFLARTAALMDLRDASAKR